MINQNSISYYCSMNISFKISNAVGNNKSLILKKVKCNSDGNETIILMKMISDDTDPWPDGPKGHHLFACARKSQSNNHSEHQWGSKSRTLDQYSGTQAIGHYAHRAWS